MQRAVNSQLIKDILQGQEEKTTVLLALDGGGIRGIVLLQLLMNLERRIGESIYRHLDWVAGTSTGAIVALGIGLNKSLEENLKIYLRLKNEIFCNSRPYNCNRYETYLKFVFGARTKMSEIKEHK
uniref:PNPLA domain-containing protein n=1 Tax=Panagrolaimus superbus TaxID=310955 RepID=A0A914YNW4_9BILA